MTFPKCRAAHGWKGRTFCVRFRWHLGRHRDRDGTRW